MHVIYCIENKINGKRYIGQTKNLQRRLNEHFSTTWEPRTISLIKRAIKKYGKDNFSVELLAECKDAEDANIQEKFFILFYDTINTGYNIHSGGYDTKERKSKTKGQSRKPLSDETRQKISQSKIGKKRSCSSIDKQKETVRNQPKEFNVEKSKRTTQRNKERGCPDEIRNKIIESTIGRRSEGTNKWYEIIVALSEQLVPPADIIIVTKREVTYDTIAKIFKQTVIRKHGKEKFDEIIKQRRDKQHQRSLQRKTKMSDKIKRTLQEQNKFLSRQSAKIHPNTLKWIDLIEELAADGCDIFKIRERVNFEVILGAIKRITKRVRKEKFTDEQIKELESHDKEIGAIERLKRSPGKKLTY